MSEILNLCKRGCCPTIEFDNDLVIIKDDYNGKVQLTRDELERIIGLYKEVNKSDGCCGGNCSCKNS